MTGLIILCAICMLVCVVLSVFCIKLTKKNRENTIKIDTIVDYVDNIEKKTKDMEKSFEKVATEYKDMKRDNIFITGELHRIENMLVILNNGFPVESKM